MNTSKSLKPGMPEDKRRQAVGGEWSHTSIEDARAVQLVLAKQHGRLAVAYLSEGADRGNDRWDTDRSPKWRVIYRLSVDAYAPSDVLDHEVVARLEARLGRSTRPVIVDVPVNGYLEKLLGAPAPDAGRMGSEDA